MFSLLFGSLLSNIFFETIIMIMHILSYCLWARLNLILSFHTFRPFLPQHDSWLWVSQGSHNLELGDEITEFCPSQSSQRDHKYHPNPKLYAKYLVWVSNIQDGQRHWKDTGAYSWTRVIAQTRFRIFFVPQSSCFNNEDVECAPSDDICCLNASCHIVAAWKNKQLVPWWISFDECKKSSDTMSWRWLTNYVALSTGRKKCQKVWLTSY